MSDEKKNTPQSPEGNAPRGSRRNQQAASQASKPDSRPGRGATGTTSKKYLNQQQKEAMYQRWLYIGLGVAAALILLSLGVGALWQYQIMPNQTLAVVNGEKITRKDYWEFQDITLYNQARLYENMALQYTGQEQSQFLLYSSQLDAARADVEGSTTVSEQTLTQMIEDRLYVKAAEDQGVDMSRPVLIEQTLNSWAPADAPLVTPIPSPTMIPQRAEWATQTAEAQQTQQAEQAALLGTPVATPVTEATPSASPVASPVMDEPKATPDMAVVRTDAEADYQAFLNDVLADSGLSEDEYLELFAKPQVARAHIDAEIVASIPQSAPQVEVSHIMVNTEDLANEVSAEIANGNQTFDEAASIWSQDTASAGNDGKLGWVTNGELPEDLNTAVFDMQPGDISEPIQTPFGWHIVMVTGKDEDRALTPKQYDLKLAEARKTFLEDARAASEIESDHYNPTPQPTASVFTPPVDAPTPIVATPVPAKDLSATPIAGPAFGSATPVASPTASPTPTPKPN